MNRRNVRSVRRLANLATRCIILRKPETPKKLQPLKVVFKEIEMLSWSLATNATETTNMTELFRVSSTLAEVGKQKVRLAELAQGVQ